MISLTKKILRLTLSLWALTMIVFFIVIFFMVRLDLLTFLSVAHKLINGIQIVFSIITFAFVVIIYKSFNKRIKFDTYNRAVFLKENSEEHYDLQRLNVDLVNKMEIIAKQFQESNKKINEILFNQQIEQNNTALEEKLTQAANSVNFDNNVRKTAAFNNLTDKIIKAVGDFYRKVREEKKDVIRI